MELDFFSKITTIFEYSTQSFLMIEVFLAFFLAFLFLLLNLKYKKKFITYFLPFFLLYVLISSLVIFHQDFFVATKEILKKIVEYFYFSPIPIYFLTVLLSFLFLFRTILAKTYTKRHKILSYLLLLPIFYFFVSFMIVCSENQISLSQITEIYSNQIALSLIQVSQVFFFLYLGTCFFRFLYHFSKRKL